jgi:poly(hydroxyalkanoate) depolymerase family esterase
MRRHTFSFRHGKLDYLLYVPTRVEGPPPLVIMLHGCTQSAMDFAEGTQMNALAEELGIIVAYPEQTQIANPQKCWNWFRPGDQQNGRGEPAMIAGIARTIIENHEVDPARVYVAGLSAGGAAASIMACAYPNMFAAAGTFAPGDKVMQIENDYDKEVYNGDIGYVEGVDLTEGELTANFDGRTVTYLFGELDTLVLAYAATIHKSQGSEYPAVVIPVLTQHYAMLQRNLLYNGITRGKRLVVIVGQRNAVAIAVKNVAGRRRWSKLDEWLELSPATARELME